MIFPRPQKYCLNGDAVHMDGIAFCVEGDEADYVSAFLRRNSFPLGGEYEIRAEIIGNRETEYIEEANRLSSEKYKLNISPKGVRISCSARKGLFYALNTLVKLLKTGELRIGYIEDYPLFARRGYIEGFYGAPWSDFNRRDVMELMAAHGMNTYFYAPKDDPFHRSRWREKYPQSELEKLKSLCELARCNEVDFVWCIAPGLDVKYSSEQDLNAVFEKISQLYEIGIRNFGLLLDDIPEQLQFEEDKLRFSSAIDAHIFFCNAVFNRLRELDRRISLTVCPLQYHGHGNEYYISKFGCGIEPEIDVFWTGQDICSQRLTVAGAFTFIESTHHRPLYWDNYPVNDTEMLNEMHLGAVIGREKELYRYSAGLIANTMEMAQCSKIPLLTIADYLWNPLAYDEKASFEYALETVAGEDSEKFKLIAEHLQVSCLSRYASQGMSDFCGKFRFEMMNDGREKAAEMLDEYTASLEGCAAMLSQDKPLYNELRQWADKFEFCVKILRCCVDFLKNPTDKERLKIREKLKNYNRDGTVLTGFCFTETVNFITQENNK